MANTLEARAVITAEDKTGKAFDSFKARVAAVSKQIEAFDRVMGPVEAVARSVNAIAPAVDRSSAAMSRLIETGRSVDSVSTAIGNVERSAGAMTASMSRSSAAVAKLGSELFEAGGKLKAIETFRTSSRAIDEASLAMRRAQQDVRRLGAEVGAAENPTRSLHAALDRAKADVIQASDAFKQQGVAVREARAGLEAFGIPLNKVRSEEERLKGVVESTTAAIRQQVSVEREATAATEMNARAQAHAAQAADKAAREQHRFAEQRAHGMAHEGFTRFALTNAAMAVGAGEVAHLGSEAWQQGAELNHERIGLQNAGRTSREIQEIEAAARNVVSTLPTASFTESMKVVAETTQAFGSVEHAVANLPFMMRTMSILKTAGGEHIHGSAGDVGRALAKTFEERQTRPEDFEKEASQMIPAMVASGGTFNPEQLYMFAQQAKSALPSLSMRFLSKVAPSLIGAQGGERAGTALNAFENTISGKAHDAKQVEAFLKLGLLDPSMVMGKAGHQTSWKSGAVKDTFLAMTDPLAWSEKYLIPALQKQGVDTNNREAVKQILDTMFRNQNANLFASEITQAASRARLHKDEDLINKTGSPDDIYERNKGDFLASLDTLKTALGNLASASTSPMMKSAAVNMTALAGILNKASVYGYEHPGVAVGAGVAAAGGALYGAGRLSYSIMNGFGLNASATALTDSAIALDAAATKMGLAAEEGGLAGLLPGGKRAASGALMVESLEVAATAGVTLTASSVAILGLTAAAVIAGLRASMDPKHRASDEPGFAKPFGPGGFDLNTAKDAGKSWFNRDPGAPRHGFEPGHHDLGPHYLDLKNPPFFATAPLGSDGRPIMGPFGTLADAADRRTWAHIGPDTPLPRPGFSPAFSPSAPVPVAIVSAPPTAPLGSPTFHDGWLDGERPAIEERARRGAAMFRQDPEGTRGQHMLDHNAEISPHVDTSGLEAGKAAGGELQETLAAIAAMVVTPTVNPASLAAAAAMLKGIRADLEAINRGGTSGGTSGSVGTSYPQTSPTGRQGGPR